jgi:hydroxyquinol 1,2-dioxygenase
MSADPAGTSAEPAGTTAEAAAEPAEFGAETLTEAVAASFQGADPRLRDCLASITRHLHAAVREVRPTPEEWDAAVRFLTATGQKSGPTRQEFVLLSDVLGISSLVQNINQAGSPAATEGTVLGPFHVTQSPRRALGDSIDELGGAHPCLVTGRVLAADGTPLAGAQVDVWQADEAGFYDVQQPGVQPAGNGRGLFSTDDEGRFWFLTVVPRFYPIPADGPVGELLRATGRHPNRPAHIHFIATAAGHRPVTTHIFVSGSPYLGSDPVFAVKRSLIREFTEVDDPAAAAGHGLPNPYRQAHIDLVLDPEGGGGGGEAVGGREPADLAGEGRTAGTAAGQAGAAAGLRLATVTRENVRAACALEIRPEQQGTVAPVARSLAEAYAVGDVAWPRLVYDGDQVVGFIMGAFGADDAEEIYRSYIWRLNVAAQAQGRGYGRFAVQAFCAEARRRGHRRVKVSWVPHEHGPEEFYLRLGFRKTGEIRYGEVVGELLLD